jgi:sugar lactone lactonase YvrE
MMRLRLLVPLLGFASLSLLAVACGSDGSTSDGAGGAGATGGAGGEGATPTAGDAGDSNEGGGCSDSGTGTLVFEVSGLPDGVAPDISTTGADELAVSEAGSLEDLPAGNYAVTAARVFDEDPIVRTVYDATVTAPSFCLADGDSHTVKVKYQAIPTSNKLWMPTDMDDELAGFSSQAIAASGMTDASVSIDGPGSKSVAFDEDGNLWALGPTLADPHVVRFKAADLATSGMRTPDIEINLPDITCSVAFNNLAFDADGNLWLSSGCAGQVLRLPAADIATSGDKTADVVVGGLTANEGIAFDKSGNLWVGGGAELLRFDAARLGASTDEAADLSATVTAAIGKKPIKTDVMAFDQAGNLWGVDEGGNWVFQLAAAGLDQTGAKTVQANVSFVVGVTALPMNPAFDESNNLWLALSSGTFGGFSPAQLGASKDTGAPVTPAILISSDSVGAGLPVAFFPAPVGLPLYHAIPKP